MLFQASIIQILGSSCLLLILHLVYKAFFVKRASFLTNLPIVGVKKQWLGWSRATLMSVRQTEEWAFEGYQKVSSTMNAYRAIL